MPLSDLNTPTLILDLARLDRNIKTLQQKMAGSAVRLRPHLKTCKSLAVANRVFDGGKGGITVSTLHEAQYFLEGGYTDILYAVSISPAKLHQVKALQDKGARITLLLDNLDAAQQTAKIGRVLGTCFPCLVEIDCDGKRAGVKPGNSQLIDIAKYLHKEDGVSLEGVMTHAGGSYACHSIEGITSMAEQERLAITTAAEVLRQQGLPCPVVSLGSTPTAYFADNFNGITEVRAGVYVFQDMVMHSLGVCDTSDIALSVLATVISHKKDENRILIDAGSLALSADPGKKNKQGEAHFGQVCKAETCQPYADLWITSTNQEHGLISLDHTELDFEEFPIGTQVRVLPNHACITAAAYPGYHIVEGGTEIVDYWERCNGW